MTKKDFIKAYAEKVGCSQKECDPYVTAFLDTVEDSLSAGEDVQFVGWGTFAVKQTAERMGRNPKTGDEIKIPAKKVAKFKPGKKLADKVNN